MMANIRGRNTNPELLVRSLIHRAGFRFKLHDTRLPGSPDLVLPSRSAVIFVHGCFWHLHGCKYTKMPGTRVEFWHPKLTRNKMRDQQTVAELVDLGWRVCIVWECATREAAKTGSLQLSAALSQFINSNRESIAEIAVLDPAEISLIKPNG